MEYEKIHRANEAEKLLQIKEKLAYSKELIPLMLNADTRYRFELEVGNVLNDTLLSVTAFYGANNETMTLYAFDPEKRKAEKVKIIKEMFEGKVELSDFTDMRFY